MNETIRIMDADELERHLDELGELLLACVRDGASIGFVLPFDAADGAAWWRDKVLPALRRGGLHLLVARRGGRIVGTVQLDCDTPPNQPHRAEVRKMMVHPGHRRQGLARALLARVEALARARGRTLLTLDTRVGDGAEPLYASTGFVVAGRIPAYCRDTIDPARFDATTVMYKALVSSAP